MDLKDNSPGNSCCTVDSILQLMNQCDPCPWVIKCQLSQRQFFRVVVLIISQKSGPFAVFQNRCIENWAIPNQETLLILWVYILI